MARMLADRDSSALHLSLTRRHERLATRYQQTALVAAIKPLIAALKSRQTTAEDKAFDRQSAYDEVLAADGDLDDAVRSLYNAAETHDRENLAAGTLAILFPEGGFLPIIEITLAQEPAVVDALATKVDGLGANHPLAPQAAKLRTFAQAVRDALAALDTAVRAQKNAEAEEELAQAALRRQYEANYLDARKALGRTLAERLFPRSPRGADSQATPSPAP